MNENEPITTVQQTPETLQAEGTTPPPQPPKGAKERFYDKLPVTKRMMDIICALLIAAIVIALVLGITQGA